MADMFITNPWASGDSLKQELTNEWAAGSYMKQGPSDEEKTAALIQIAVAAGAMILYGIEIADSFDKLGDYLDKQTTYTEYYHDRYVNNTFPQQMNAIQSALAYEVFGPDYSAYPYWVSIAERHVNASQSYEGTLLDSYCLNDFSDCDKELQNKVPTIAGDASFIEVKTEERMEERMRSEKWELISATLRVINKSPDNIFKYINNAINIRQGLLNMATQGFNGALGSISMELGSLMPKYAKVKKGS